MFLAPDGEGGVVVVNFLIDAVPFENREAAVIAAVDHLDGLASVTQIYKPVSFHD